MSCGALWANLVKVYHHVAPVFCLNMIYPSMSNYSNWWRLLVCDLKAGVEDLNVPSHSIFLDGLQNTSWLKHIRAILEASVFVSVVSDIQSRWVYLHSLIISPALTILIFQKICEGSSVLVHCSDGWDRTSQTCALACLLLDPYYRTLHGFMVR